MKRIKLFPCLYAFCLLSNVFAQAPSVLPSPVVSQLQPTQAVQPTQVVPSIQSSVPISAPTQPVIPLTSPITDQPNPITLTTQQPELTTSKALSFSTIVTVINGVTKIIIQTISPQPQFQPQASSSALSQTQTIVIAVVAVILVILILIFIMLCLRKKRKRKDIMYRPEMYQSATKETPLINASIPEHHDDETQNNLHDINGHLEKKELFNKDTIEGQNVFYSDQYYHDQQVQGQRQLNPQTYYFDRQQDMNEINQHEHHFIENQLNREQQQQQQQVYLERRGIMMNGQDVMYQDENGYYYNLPYNHDVNNSNTYLNEAQTHIPNENSGLVTLVGAENTK